MLKGREWIYEAEAYQREKEGSALSADEGEVQKPLFDV